ncbi:AAA family ATPase [Hymenobacter ruber]
MPKYFSNAAFISEFKKLRHSTTTGKVGKEQTSALCTLLAFDMAEKSLGKDLLDLSVNSGDRSEFSRKFDELMTFGQEAEGVLLVDDLGYLSYSDGTASSRLSKNFLTTILKKASEAAAQSVYPRRGAAVLNLGLSATKYGTRKVADWKGALTSHVEERELDTFDDDSFDLTPLAMFVLRDFEFPDSIVGNPRKGVTAALHLILTDDVADYLAAHLYFDGAVNYFDDKPLSDELDVDALLKDSQEEDGGGSVKPSKSQAVDSEFPRNRIIYGAPGTGKSNKLKTESTGFEETRVMFHPDYTYSQFVGGYRPATLYRTPATGVEIFDVSKKDKIDPQLEPVIDYALASGPFLDVLVKALNDPSKNYLLLIEEINRANVAAVFGDVFQLLDRNDDGVSEYDVTPNREIGAFLKEAVNEFSGKMQLPANMYIWATMNSADQGVFPMDSAFKRRWSFEYLPLNQPEQDALLRNLKLSFLGKEYYWVPFRKALNSFLTEKAKVSEDKLLGAFYMKASELSSPAAIKNKLLLYLREDVLRHNAKALFEKPTFSQIAEAYDKADGGLFNAAFIESLTEANVTYAADSGPAAAEAADEDEDAAEDDE